MTIMLNNGISWMSFYAMFLQKFRTHYTCLPQLHQLFNIIALQNRIHTHAHLEHVLGIKSFKDQLHQWAHALTYRLCI